MGRTQERLRYCSICTRLLPESQFYERALRASVGRRNTCIKCQRERGRTDPKFTALVQSLIDEGRSHPAKPDGVCTYGECAAPAVADDALCLPHIWRLRLSPEARDLCPVCRTHRMRFFGEFESGRCVRCRLRDIAAAVTSSLWGMGITAVSA